jgi:hypothetical protein
MRCSIFSSFFNKTSFASPSAAHAPLQLKIDITLAASNAPRLKRRPRWNSDTGKRRQQFNSMTAPKICGVQGSTTSAAPNTAAKNFGNQK